MNFYIYEFPNVYWHGKVHSDCCTVFLWDLVYEIYSTEWRPSIGACRLFWLLLRAEMAVLNHFFAKYIFYICDKARTKIWPRFCSFRGLIPRLWFFAPFPADFAPFLVVSQQSTGTCMRSQPPTRWSKQKSKWQYRDHLVGQLTWGKTKSCHQSNTDWFVFPLFNIWGGPGRKNLHFFQLHPKWVVPPRLVWCTFQRFCKKPSTNWQPAAAFGKCLDGTSDICRTSIIPMLPPQILIKYEDIKLHRQFSINMCC